MKMRFGLSGATLGALAGLGVGLAAVIGWHHLRSGPAPVPPQAQSAAQLPTPPTAGVAPKPVVQSAAPATPPQDAAPAGAGQDMAPPRAADLAAQAAKSTMGDVSPAEVPRFDTFHVAHDGGAVVAGIARGASTVAVLVDGVEISRATPGQNGRFAALFTLSPSTAPRMLSLRAQGKDGVDVTSEESILIAPSAPAELAQEEAEQPAPTALLAQLPDAASISQAVVHEGEGADDPINSAVGVKLSGHAPSAGTPASVPMQNLASAKPVAGESVFVAGEAPSAAPVPTAVLLSAEGARKLDAPRDGSLAIDTISYAPSGAVSVAGRGAAGQGLRLYVDNAPKLDVMIDPEGRWRGELPEVLPGLYTLRADQLDEGGNVLARSETPFLREAPEALAATTPESHAGARNAPVAQVVTVQPGYTLWGIAKSAYGDGVRYVQVFEANRSQIRNPDLIYPGQVFSLPTQE